MNIDQKKSHDILFQGEILLNSFLSNKLYNPSNNS